MTPIRGVLTESLGALSLDRESMATVYVKGQYFSFRSVRQNKLTPTRQKRIVSNSQT